HPAHFSCDSAGGSRGEDGLCGPTCPRMAKRVFWTRYACRAIATHTLELAGGLRCRSSGADLLGAAREEGIARASGATLRGGGHCPIFSISKARQLKPVQNQGA